MKYFTINELCKSNTAVQKGIDNTPNQQIIDNLEQLVLKILDPLREAYGKPIIVNSGYRSAELNRAINGAKFSQHLKGQAADITGKSKENNKKLFELIQSLQLPYDQLIDEQNFSWIHVSFSNNLRQQILRL